MMHPRHFQTSSSQNAADVRRAAFWIAVTLASGVTVNLLAIARKAAAGILFGG